MQEDPMRTLMLLTLLTGAAHAQTCPSGARYATNGADLSFCLYENITLPISPAADCGSLQISDQIGFSWPLAPNPSYTCPAGSSSSVSGGEGFCLYDVTAPTWASPYCNYLTDGYIGYVWRECPPSGTFSDTFEEAFCSFSFRAPLGAQAYCGNLSEGVFGYSYPIGKGINMGYRCPGGFTQGSLDVGTGLCTIPGITPGPEIQADCSKVSQGQLGYHWYHPHVN
jgi:hypothetical protein